MVVLRSTALLGAVGLAYAVLLRLWMRYVTPDEPEFTWAGTLAIVISLTVLGLMAGLVRGLRITGRNLAGQVLRVPGLILSLGCFLAAGALMFPTVVPASLGLGRTGWWKWVRGLLVLGGVGFAVFVVATSSAISDERRVSGGVIYLMLFPVEVALMTQLWKPIRATGPEPRT